MWEIVLLEKFQGMPPGHVYLQQVAKVYLLQESHSSHTTHWDPWFWQLL